MHTSTVSVVRNPPHVSLCDEAVSQADGAVRPDLQSFRQFANQYAAAPGEPFDGQKGLMLLGRKALRPRGLFAETQELPQRPADICEQFVFGFGDAGRSRGHTDRGRIKTVCARSTGFAACNYVVLRYNDAVYDYDRKTCNQLGDFRTDKRMLLQSSG
jgi:hypothetical protein